MCACVKDDDGVLGGGAEVGQHAVEVDGAGGGVPVAVAGAGGEAGGLEKDKGEISARDCIRL